MTAEDETVITVTRNASWLPPHGRAEVIRRSAPPQPMCVARLLLRRADLVFCVPRDDGGSLDLPMRVAGAEDRDGALAIASLAERITGSRSPLEFVGAVRNVVESPHDGYPWPTPLAHFGVWTSQDAPIVEGEWLSTRGDSSLRDRHWYPLVSTLELSN